MTWTCALLGAGTGDARRLYLGNCAVCHGPDGRSRGAVPLRLPGRVLADPRWQAKAADEDLLRAILEGKGAMPAFKTRLSPAEARALLEEQIRPMARPSRSSR